MKERWFNHMEKLKKKINFQIEHRLYKTYENDIIIGKTSETSENYDILVFCLRTIKTFTIPNFIKQIGSFAFENCKQLRTVMIPIDSNLQTIGKGAFCESSIVHLTIPSNLTHISEYTFSKYKSLQKIYIPNDMKLDTIEEYAFDGSSIEKVKLSPNITWH